MFERNSARKTRLFMFQMNQMEIYAKYLPHRCLKTKIRQAIMSGCAGFCIKIENAASDPGGHAAF